MTLHTDVLPGAQQRILHSLGAFATRSGFYLGGGTAIAIHLGHRRSIDLDWFAPDAIRDPMRLAAEVRDVAPDFAPSATAEGTLHGSAGGVKLSFLEYRYSLLEPLVPWPEFECQLAAPQDLACMKLSAVASRGAKKDFIDVYALGETYFSLEEMLALYRRKYALADVGHVLMSLTYFDDADLEEAPEMLCEIEWSEVKRAVEGWVRKVVNRGVAG